MRNHIYSCPVLNKKSQKYFFLLSLHLFYDVLILYYKIPVYIWDYT